MFLLLVNEEFPKIQMEDANSVMAGNLDIKAEVGNSST